MTPIATALAPMYPLSTYELRKRAADLRGAGVSPPQPVVVPSMPAPAVPAPPVATLPAIPPIAPVPSMPPAVPAVQAPSPLQVMDVANVPEPTRTRVLTALMTGNDPTELETLAAQVAPAAPAAAAALRLRASMVGRLVPLPAPTPAAPPAPAAPAPAPVTPAPAVPEPAPPPAAPAPAPAAPPAEPIVPGLPAIPAGLGLDPGLPPDVAQAVQRALTSENDPEKLRGFAATLTPKFPLAAGLLTGKANALALLRPAPPAAPPAQPGVTPPAPATPAKPTPSAPGGGGGNVVPAGPGRYVVQAGDFPIKIAKKITGDGNRWKELVAANPEKKRAADGNFASLLPGETLKLPASWPQEPLIATKAPAAASASPKKGTTRATNA